MCRTAVQHLRTILILVLTNSEVRKLLSDLSIIGRDLLARGASKVVEGIRPDQEALARVDESAPQDQFVTENGCTVGPNETPVLEARIPGTDIMISQHPKDDLGTGSKITNAGGQAKSGEEAYRAARNQASQITNTKSNGQNSDEADDKRQGFVDKIRSVKVCFQFILYHRSHLWTKDNLADRVPQQHKDKIQEKLDRGKQFLTEEYFPPERRDQFIFRGKKVSTCEVVVRA
jgi:hypothetical protein